jgi:glutathione S-transferase
VHLESGKWEEIFPLNPLRQIPVLLRPDGSPLYDSTVICAYLDAASLGAHLQTVADPWQKLTRVALADGLMEAVLQRRMEQVRPAGERSAGFIARLEERAARAIDRMEADVDALAGPAPRLDQIATAVALEYTDFRYPHDWRTGHPKLAAWLAGFGARPSMVASRPQG